ncbi:MAG: D-alanyl-D-alanine carboxypeptidase [Spirochaetaceae bacterium]|jgi:D-alanyl-D-alanine carboxypeptidase (penicillin-binding protein 5/6)|nr:D-alanyl-D-alanine carboxypeptidase [Spirochaetaceae bacterium]
MKRSFVLMICLTRILAAQEPPDIVSRSAVLMDATTGTVLFAKNADSAIPPASLTKLMTMHLALAEVSAGRASLDEVIPLPSETWAENQPSGSSLMFLARGQSVTLHELLLGLIISSGNDAAIAVALRFDQTVAQFAQRMNEEARKMGFLQTYFVEPSGVSEKNMTTASDFASFCREYIRLHPETLQDYHSVPNFAYPKAYNVPAAYRSRPGTIVQYNRNTLLGTVKGVDGLKTGYIDESGYNIALTAERNGTRLIAVVLGAPADSSGTRIRDNDGKQLLEFGFEHYKTVTVRPHVDSLKPVRLWLGKTNWVEVAVEHTIAFTTAIDRARTIYQKIEIDEPVLAPLDTGAVIGKLIFYDERGTLAQSAIFTTAPVEKGGFFKRFFDRIRLWWKNLTDKTENKTKG